MAPGVLVRHVIAGPFEGLAKEDLPAQLCAFTNGVLRAEAARPPGCYDLVHSHYWLSGQVGWLAKDRWGVPLVHTAHTLAKVKNRLLAAGDQPEPTGPRHRRGAGRGRGRPAWSPTPRPRPRDLIDLLRRRPAAGSPSSSPASTWTGSAPATPRAAARRPAPLRPARATGTSSPSSAASSRSRRPTCCCAPPPSCASSTRRWPTADRGHRAAGPSGSGLDRPTALIDSPPRWASPTRCGSCRRSRGEDLADALPGRRPGRGAEPQRVVRPGRAGGAGLRHAGGRGRGRRPGDRGPRRGLRRARRRPRPGRLGRGARPICSGSPARRAKLSPGRGRHAREFSWSRRRPACSPSTVRRSPSTEPGGRCGDADAAGR